MGIVLDPPTAAAGIRIGADRTAATSQCEALGEPKTFQRGDEANPSLAVHRPSGLSVFVYFDDADAVEAVELGRSDGGETVTFRDIDLFATPKDALLEELGRHAEVQVEDDGRSVTAPSLLLALWRPPLPEDADDEAGRYFESVLVARPDYYD